MRSFWHPFSDTVLSQIAHWATPVAASLTWVAHWCSLKMLCLLEFQAHNGQVAAVLLPNLCMPYRLLSNVAVQPPAKCSSMSFLLKHMKTLFLPFEKRNLPGGNSVPVGPYWVQKPPLWAPWCALIIILKPNRFASSRPKVHSYEVTCISCPFHCLCYAKTMESLVFL